MRYLNYIFVLGVLLLGFGCGILDSDNTGVTPGPEPPLDPSATLPNSLHGTASGMQWWYEQPDGAGAVFGVSWEQTGCGDCHTDSCDDCHGDAAGATPAEEPTKCLNCHGRIGKENVLELTDVHFDAGFVCSDCHSMAELHGDGNSYDSMFAFDDDPLCTDCHGAAGSNAPGIPATQPHSIHGDAMSCDACHLDSVITCYNCHFETLLDTHEKKAAAAFKNFLILLNDKNGQVRAGTYQSVVYNGDAIVAYGPYHGHSIQSEGRGCAECHGGPRMVELRDTGRIQMTWWDEAEGKVMHTDGVIPFQPDVMDFQFVDFVGGAWQPMDLATSQVAHNVQYKFCSPLTTEQLDALGATEGGGGAIGNLGSSLHGTARGMEWWYNEPDGLGDMIGIDYEQTGCGNCHTDGCDDCHANADGTGGVDEPTVCKNCHGRLGKEEQLEINDLHFAAGMVCSDCHSSEEIHGDGNIYNSMFEASALDPACVDCHNDLDMAITEHGMHGEEFGCDTCHMETSVTCYNCHFETLLDSHEKKAAAAFKNFALLMNDANGKLRLGTYQSVYYDGNGFAAFGPYHGHSVTADGRTCDDCHNNARIQEYNDTGEILMSWWDDGAGKVAHTDGVIPFVPDDFVFQFVDFDGTSWSPVTPTDIQFQWKFCSPLDAGQLDAMALELPSAENLANSLHGSARGMEWWYNEPDGLGDMIGVDYADTGCGNCHTDGCDDCHDSETFAVDQPTVCKNCHGRLGKEEQLELTDLHFTNHDCTFCHSLEEIHGDGNTYNSMFEASELDPACTDCHGVPDDGGNPFGPHSVHGDAVACDACHMETSITCYNCHFETLLDTHEKKAAAAFKNFALLLNDQNGVVRLGTYQSVYYQDNGFVAFGPFHGHTVTADARDCGDCHGSSNVQDYRLTGEIQMTTWDEVEGKPVHLEGIIPFVPDAMNFQFLDFDGTNWSPVDPTNVQYQYKFCDPLTTEQIDSLALAWPGDTLASSLHGTAAGMQYWYEHTDGLGALIGVDYADTGCGNCHVDTTAADGGCSECHGAADVHEPITNQLDVCIGCHARQNSEVNLGLTDVHFIAGMECSECHFYDIHGDGNTYDAMYSPGAMRADCENCHKELNMTITEHSLHADQLHCDACHVQTSLTCYNCHFDSLIDSHVKKPFAPFTGFVLLVNDPEMGKVRVGTYQSVIEGGTNTFVAIGPFHGHSVTADGRNCSDCHDNDRIDEYNTNGVIEMAWWDTDTIVHTTGAVPFIDGGLQWEFVDYDPVGDTWASVGTELDQLQYLFCEPLTADQLADLGVE